MQKRRQYTEEFKREAVAFADQPGVTLAQVARDLGINPNMLYRWRAAMQADGSKAFPGKGNARDEEMVKLKRELRRVTQERDFLKEAAAYFAKESK